MKRIVGEQAAPRIPNSGGDPALPITGIQLEVIAELLHKLLEQQKLTNLLLAEIGK